MQCVHAPAFGSPVSLSRPSIVVVLGLITLAASLTVEKLKWSVADISRRVELSTRLVARPAASKRKPTSTADELDLESFLVGRLMSNYLPHDLPSSFDPALHLHSGGSLIDASHSDDIEILNVYNHETNKAKTTAGIVIQHRAWKLPEVFRSQDDPANCIKSPLLERLSSSRRAELQASPAPLLHSSPPSFDMPYLSSSPVTYPTSSSPVKETSNKRKRLDEPRSPLTHTDGNAVRRKVGAFVESDSDGEESALETLPKRRAFKKPLHLDEDTSFRTIGDILDGQEPHGFDNDPKASYIDEATATCEGLPSTLNPPDSRLPLTVRSSSGKVTYAALRQSTTRTSYERLIAARSEHVDGRADKSFYGVDIHQLMDDATIEMAEHKARVQLNNTTAMHTSVEVGVTHSGKNRSLLWTEKYRARKFTDLVGDERTHRSTLRWLKAWDEIVFPGATRSKPKKSYGVDQSQEDRKHRKILMLTGPPGLGKTTLAHVCARQAGYAVQEINASDERSSNVVKGRIRDMVGTENINGGKASKPVCIVVDEVDGVVGGNSGGGGEGGFVKALIDLVLLDQRNSKQVDQQKTALANKTRKGDKFRLMRPLILICNDVYHPSLRPLRQSSLAEIIHMRKPALSMVALRMQSIFERENVPCDGDGVRRLCEATWGVSNHKEGKSGSGTVEGDIRSVMVVAEWVAGKLRSSNDVSLRLTRRWFEENILNDLAHGGGAARSLGRGGAKEAVERIFLEGAGFPKTHVAIKKSKGDGSDRPVGVAEAAKRRAIDRLREMIDMSGDVDRIMSGT